MRSFVVALLFVAASAAADEVQVISWNLHGLPFAGGGERLPVAAKEILRHAPDFVFLQEIWVHPQANRLIEQFRLAGYDSAEYLSIAPIRTGGLLVFVNVGRGWRIVSSRFVEYSDTAPFWRVREADGMSGKGMLIVEVERAGRRAVIVDTHLQSQYGLGREYEEIRKSQLDELNQEAANAWIIAGDFNTDWKEKLYRDFVAAGWTDAVADIRQAYGKGSHFVSETDLGDWIDYVFVRGPATFSGEVLENEKRDVPYSDHQGLRVKITTP
jgi:endonuclease/exonuclease/phosphatase family metal-dependent hydrolase